MYSEPRCHEQSEQVGCPLVVTQVRIHRLEKMFLSPRTVTSTSAADEVSKALLSVMRDNWQGCLIVDRSPPNRLPRPLDCLGTTSFCEDLQELMRCGPWTLTDLRHVQPV